MSTITLSECITPSRSSIISNPFGQTKKGGKSKVTSKSERDEEGLIVLPDYVSPPPKDSREKREWDRMSTRMQGFHSYFRMAFKQIFELSDGSFQARGLSVPDFMEVVEDFLQHLTFHHGIEEQHIFPILKQRMPHFQLEHQEEHDAIHKGMHDLEELTKKYKKNPTSYSPEELKTNLKSWGPLLFWHLDAEVESLKADVLRRYYTLEEVKRLPM
ncbi:hemerythrin domain-containing protein [Sporobolomyces salmoneus]|uniref:hemerythrin domain-containing protein n=1 Tax=Sporobolomyces salmoneus TaxID=183962 RepID=UPI003170682E